MVYDSSIARLEPRDIVTPLFSSCVEDDKPMGLASTTVSPFFVTVKLSRPAASVSTESSSPPLGDARVTSWTVSGSVESQPRAARQTSPKANLLSRETAMRTSARG